MHLLLKVSFILCGLLTIGCSPAPKEPVNKVLMEGIEQRKNNPENIQAIDTAVTLLQTGDIVVRMGNDITSYMLSQLNQHDKTYSHCGLVVVEQGYPFVYHSIGGEANPDARLRRDSAARWLSPADNLGFGIARMNASPQQNDSLRSVVKALHRARKKFDMDFDLRTNDRLYCAEFVYKAVNQAMKDSTYIKPSSIMGYSFVGVDDVFHNPHAHSIWQIRFK